MVALEEQIAEIERELDFRRRVFPSWVERGSLTQIGADLGIARMEAVLETLKGIKEERKERGLFDNQIQEAIDR